MTSIPDILVHIYEGPNECTAFGMTPSSDAQTQRRSPQVTWRRRNVLVPQLYVQHNKVQRHDAQRLLEEYIHLVRWRPDGDDRIMDIGCGPGDVTTQILLPKLPNSMRELVATDVSAQMIQYARSHHQHPRVTYDVLDIGTQTLPSAYHEKFDHVFSFYCLHWVQDQRQAMKNIFDMLRPGGDILLTFFVHAPILDVFMKVCNKDHWKPHIKESSLLPIYQSEQNVAELLHDLLQEVGFKSIICQFRRLKFTYESTHAFADEMTAAHSLFRKMPQALRAQFVDESSVELNELECRNENVFSYVSIVINARKPRDNGTTNM